MNTTLYAPSLRDLPRGSSDQWADEVIYLPAVAKESILFSALLALRRVDFVVFLYMRGVRSIRVEVKFSGYIAASLGYREKVVELEPSSTVRDLLGLLELPVSNSWVAVSIGGRLRDRTTILKDGDQVLVLPLGGGG